MEGAVTQSVEYLIKTYGLAGIVILIQAWGIWRLMKRDDERQAKLDALQETRVTEAKESTKALEANTDSLVRLTDVIRDRFRPTL